MQFRTCVYNVVLNHCTPLERERFFSYLLDKVNEISYKCGNDTSYFDNYDTWHPMNGILNNGLMGTGLSSSGLVVGSGYSSGSLPPYTYNIGVYGNGLSPYSSNRYGNNYPYSGSLNYPQAGMFLSFIISLLFFIIF